MNNTTDFDFSVLIIRDNTEYIFLCTLGIVCILALVITLVTNTVTVVVMVTTPKLRTHTNAFIISLAVSDILFVMLIFAMFIILEEGGPYKDEYGLAINLAWEILILGSYGNLFLVSVERWIYIAKPFLYQRYVTTRAVVSSITITWFIAIVGNATYFIRVFYIRIHPYVTSIIHTAFFFILLAIYVHICLITFKHLKKLPKAGHRLSNPTRRNGSRPKPNTASSLYVENWKSIKLLISICGIFFLLVSPYVYLTTHIILTNFIKKFSYLVWWLVCFVLLSMFHCSNFFVYALGIPLFRETLKKRFCSFRCCKGSEMMNRATSSLGLETEINLV